MSDPLSKTNQSQDKKKGQGHVIMQMYSICQRGSIHSLYAWVCKCDMSIDSVHGSNKYKKEL